MTNRGCWRWTSPHSRHVRHFRPITHYIRSGDQAIVYLAEEKVQVALKRHGFQTKEVLTGSAIVEWSTYSRILELLDIVSTQERVHLQDQTKACSRSSGVE